MSGESRYQYVTMTDKMIVSDPDEVKTKDTDGNGRLYLGKRFQDKKIRYAIKIIGPADDDEEN